ncbi:MAG: B-box zinc finger protein [Anaerolineae bacterium]|nr:B-box zinc finger protein [Anaerolineae bacterium]
MTSWEAVYCANHPDRIAIERCEVCNKPLCAYCLYYTEDGQRLCADHAEQARLAGLTIEAPGAYADQLIEAQAGAVRKQKRGEAHSDTLYQGNTHDMMSFLGMLIGLIALASCCGGIYCLPLAGFVLSLVALINAKNAFDPRRTRRFGVVGMLVSGVWIAAVILCIFAFLLPFQAANNLSSSVIVWTPPAVSYTATPAPPVRMTPTPSPTPTEDIINAAAHEYTRDHVRIRVHTP